MDEYQRAIGGLEMILTVFADRYEYDANGRLVDIRSDGILPRFVLGRASEGCIWRFSTNVEPDQLSAVARLAGRELGFPIAGEKPAPPPERLVMIQRLLAREGVEADARHEILTREGVEVAELWTIN